MPIEGPEVFAALQERLRRAEESVRQVEAELAAADDQTNELLSQRGEALLGLATHYLPEISRPAIETTFAGARTELLAILTRKEARQRELAERLARGEEALKAQDDRIDEVTQRLDALVARREELEAQVAEALKADPDFQERSALALHAEQELHRDEERAAEVREEAAEKLPHYERSRLFQYLHERGYATEAYAATGLVATLDRWVAGLIGYVGAREGYEYLRKAPPLVDAEVGRRRALFDELMRQVEAGQAEAAEKFGLAAVLREGDALGTDRDGLVAAREPIAAENQEIQAELASLAKRHDVFYEEAIRRFRDFLSEARLAVIEQRARQTPEPEDDALVAELAAVDRRLDELGPLMAELSARRRAADALRDGLGRVASNFRRAEFDSRRSYFSDGLDIEQWFRDLDSGAADPETLWASLRRHQQFRPHWIEETSSGAADVLSGPAGRVLIGAVLEAANAATRAAAYRGVQRRGGGYSAPSAPSIPRSGPAARPSGGGFTSGEGF